MTKIDTKPDTFIDEEFNSRLVASSTSSNGIKCKNQILKESNKKLLARINRKHAESKQKAILKKTQLEKEIDAESAIIEKNNLELKNTNPLIYFDSFNENLNKGDLASARVETYFYIVSLFILCSVEIASMYTYFSSSELHGGTESIPGESTPLISPYIISSLLALLPIAAGVQGYSENTVKVGFKTILMLIIAFMFSLSAGLFTIGSSNTTFIGIILEANGLEETGIDSIFNVLLPIIQSILCFILIHDFCGRIYKSVYKIKHNKVEKNPAYKAILNEIQEATKRKNMLLEQLSYEKAKLTSIKNEKKEALSVNKASILECFLFYENITQNLLDYNEEIKNLELQLQTVRRKKEIVYNRINDNLGYRPLPSDEPVREIKVIN